MKKPAIIATAVILILVILGVIGFIFLAGQSEEPVSEHDVAHTAGEEARPSDNSQANEVNPTGATDKGANTKVGDVPQEGEDKRNLVIDMFNFGFSQQRIEASPGETLTIELTSSGGSHDFVIDELNVRSDVINTGGRTMVTFTIPDDAGGKTFAYYCSVMNHRAQGMEGQLVISE